ncbi:MAG TPA: hypothetical protein VF377_08890 [Acidimicrobiia bacterium]
MALGYVTSLRNAQLQALADLIDAGAGAGKLRIYSGSRPSTGGSETTILAELTLSSPPEASVSNGVLTFGTISDATAVASGTATWFRILDSDNNPLIDGSVSATGGGGDLQLNSTSIVAGGTVSITSFTITAGNA